MSFLLPIEAPPQAETGIPLGPHLHFKGAGDKTQNFSLRTKETLGRHTDTNKTATVNVNALLPNINTEGLRAETAEIILIEITHGIHKSTHALLRFLPQVDPNAVRVIQSGPPPQDPEAGQVEPKYTVPPSLKATKTPPTNEYLHFYDGGTITFLNSSKETIYAQFRNIHTKEKVAAVENAQLRTAADTLATHLGQAAAEINATLAVIKDLTSSVVDHTIVHGAKTSALDLSILDVARSIETKVGEAFNTYKPNADQQGHWSTGHITKSKTRRGDQAQR